MVTRWLRGLQDLTGKNLGALSGKVPREQGRSSDCRQMQPPERMKKAIYKKCMSADIPFEPGSKNMDVEDMPFVPEIKNMNAAGIPFLPVGVTEQKKAPDRRSGPRPGVVTGTD